MVEELGQYMYPEEKDEESMTDRKRSRAVMQQTAVVTAVVLCE